MRCTELTAGSLQDPVTHLSAGDAADDLVQRARLHDIFNLVGLTMLQSWKHPCQYIARPDGVHATGTNSEHVQVTMPHDKTGCK